MSRHWLTYYSMTDEEYKAELAEREAVRKRSTNAQP
jgi:hypothetical protein